MKGELDSISNQVEEYLLEPLLISEDPIRYPCVYISLDYELLLAHLEIHDSADFLNRLPYVEELLEDLELIVLDPSHVERVFDNTL